MADYNPSDISFSIIKETAAGVTPTTGSLLKFDHTPGSSPEFTSDFIESPVIGTNRAGGGNRKVGYRVEGPLNVHFCRNAAIELMLASALSGAWTEAGDVGDDQDVLKASNVDTSFTIEKRVNHPTAPLFSHFKGCQVTKFSLKVDASGNAEATFDVLGMDRANPTVATALTYTPSAQTMKLAGLDVTDFTVTGLTGVEFRELELTVEQAREAKDVFGSASAAGIGTGSNRKVSLTTKFYRKDRTPETVLQGNNTVAVSFKIGVGSDGFHFNLPSATASIPTDEEDGSKYMVNVNFAAKYDVTAETDLMITRT